MYPVRTVPGRHLLAMSDARVLIGPPAPADAGREHVRPALQRDWQCHRGPGRSHHGRFRLSETVGLLSRGSSAQVGRSVVALSASHGSRQLANGSHVDPRGPCRMTVILRNHDHGASETDVVVWLQTGEPHGCSTWPAALWLSDRAVRRSSHQRGTSAPESGCGTLVTSEGFRTSRWRPLRPRGHRRRARERPPRIAARVRFRWRAPQMHTRARTPAVARAGSGGRLAGVLRRDPAQAGHAQRPALASAQPPGPARPGQPRPAQASPGQPGSRRQMSTCARRSRRGVAIRCSHPGSLHATATARGTSPTR